MQRFLLVIFVVLSVNAWTNDKIKISVLTCSSGDELYSAFGHTALRVHNRQTGDDLVYNFGQFDFDTPNFYMKFLQGRLKYRLGIHSYLEFLAKYSSRGRSIVEQEISMPAAQKKQLVDTLRFLYRPENRYYLYHFMDKNCTTEVRDLIIKALGKKTSLNQKQAGITFRQMLEYYLSEKPVLKAGIDLITGTKLDRELNQLQAMALPYKLMAGIDKLKINGRPVVQKCVNVVSFPQQTYARGWFYIITFYSLLVMMWLFISEKFFVKVMWLLTSLPGIFILGLQFFSEHAEFLNNWNLLWMNPLYLLLFVKRVKNNKIIFQLFGYFVIVALTTRFIVAGLQPFNFVFLPWTVFLLLTFLPPSLLQKKIKIKQNLR